MTKRLPSSIPREAREALAASGLPWRLDPGKRHHRLVICERVVAVVPRGAGKQGRQPLNLTADIRRAIKRARDQQPEKD